MFAITMIDKVEIKLELLIHSTQTDNCKEGKLKGPGGLQCIGGNYMYCNGVEDCSDGSDESGAFW